MFSGLSEGHGGRTPGYSGGRPPVAARSARGTEMVDIAPRTGDAPVKLDDR
jgi:hypothetical protein